MRGSSIGATLIFFAAFAFAQDGRGTIGGTVTNPDGGAVAGALVQAQHMTSGVIYKAESSRTGTYAISDLPVGTYELLVPATGFTFDRYVKKGLLVQAGQTLRADVRLEWPINLGTLGDDTFLTIRNRYAGLTGPAPRTPDGKPDFSGVWNGSGDPNPEKSTPLAWAAAVQKERIDNQFKDGPSGFCLPGETFPKAPLIYKFVQTPTLIVQLTEDVIGYRQIFLDGRSHPQDPDPTWKGHSTGKWEGDTLVVDTIGFNDKGWLPDGFPQTEKLHIVERYRRPDLAHLLIDVTIEDPGVFMTPWHVHMSWDLAPGEDLLEYVCTENNLFPAAIGVKSQTR